MGCLRILVRAIVVVLVLFLVLVVALVATGNHVSAPATQNQPVVQCDRTDTGAPGTMAFGTSIDVSSLKLSCVADTFPEASSFAWHATFSTPVTVGALTVIVARVVGSGTEQTVRTYNEVVSQSDTGSFGAQADPGFLQGLGPGTYAMRIAAGTDVLAQGTFSVTP